MVAYSGLAGLYDRLMDDVDYPAWAAYYLRLLETAGVAPKRLCDCACGTGAMSVQFALRGIQVTGIDISREMLEQAQARARQSGVRAMFAEQDMCALELPRRVDALVCACDGVNYLMDDGRLNRFFVRARDSIRPGGALAFDISSAHKLEHLLGDGFFGEERDDVAYLWSNRFDKAARTVTMDLTFFVREKGDLYRRFSEVHVQKAHEAAHIAALLEKNGFSDVRIYGDKTFDAPEPDEPRIHFIAVRRQE
ncbi:MAG: class I SAM-dependent methyltransferase [Clostridia bacterium]|nr:class I SAM-dependent methyltransferase [Clostridia bacterium]